MRTFILTLAIVAAALMIPSTSSPLVTVGAVALNAHDMTLQDPQPPPQAPAPQINVEIKSEGGRAWYMSPTWMAIGAIALVLVILLIVMASRGTGGATIVKG